MISRRTFKLLQGLSLFHWPARNAESHMRGGLRRLSDTGFCPTPLTTTTQASIHAVKSAGEDPVNRTKVKGVKATDATAPAGNSGSAQRSLNHAIVPKSAGKSKSVAPADLFPTKPFLGLYEGDLVDGKRHGQGTLIGNKVTYVGSWQNNLAHGYGKATFASGTVYEGYWCEQQYHGLGKLTENASVGGRMRQGYFRHHRIVQGKAVYRSGDTYEGQWHRDRYHGKGRLTNADGSVLEGTFKNGKIYNGKGKMVINPKDPRRRVEIEGTWVNGKQQGAGQRSSVRAKFVGNWEDDLKTGKGEFTFDNGEVLRGEFHQARIVTGEGTLKTVGGGSVSVKWVDGVLQCQGGEVGSDKNKFSSSDTVIL
jgi:hypothetical protein